MQLSPCIPDTVSFDFAIPSSLVLHIRFLRSSAVFRRSLPSMIARRGRYLMPRGSKIAHDAAQYRWEGNSGNGICRSDDAGRHHLDFPGFFQKPYGAMICVLQCHMRMTRRTTATYRLERLKTALNASDGHSRQCLISTLTRYGGAARRPAAKELSRFI